MTILTERTEPQTELFLTNNQNPELELLNRTFLQKFVNLEFFRRKIPYMVPVCLTFVGLLGGTHQAIPSQNISQME